LKILDSEVTGDEPWFSPQDREQTVQELHFLKQIDQQTNQWRDLTSMNFKPQVLDKYKNNELCDIGSDHITFLRHNYIMHRMLLLYLIYHHYLLLFSMP
jgi:hypothetical protein